MKSKFKYFPGIHKVVIGLLILLSCCRLDELKSPIDGFKLLLNYDIFNTFISFRFIDAATGTVIGSTDDKKVKVTIKGQASEAVVDQLGNHETTYESVYGLLSLALNPKDPWKPTPQNILSLQIEANCTSYKPSVLNLQIDSTGQYLYKVMMEKADVDANGLKTYVFPLSLDKDGKLIDDFEFASTGNEAVVKLKKGTQFIKIDGSVEKRNTVYLTFNVYTKLSAVSVIGSLLADVTLTNGNTTKVALDHFRVIELQVKNDLSETISATANNPIQVRYSIGKTAYHPVSQKIITIGDEVRTYTFIKNSNSWQLNSIKNLTEDSSSYYITEDISTLGIHSAGMQVNLCSLDGTINYKLQGSFPQYPVPALVYLFRKVDNSYISYQRIDIQDQGLSQPLSFKVPEKTPVRIYTANQSINNSFLATPQDFYVEQGCGTFGQKETNIKSTSVEVSGNVKVNFTNDFPDAGFYITAAIYNASNNYLLWSKQYLVSKSTPELNIKANLPAETNVFLRILPVKYENSFESIPANYSFNTNSVKDKLWSFSITSIYSPVKLNFHFKLPANIQSNSYSVKAVLTDLNTLTDEGNVVFQLKAGQTDYSALIYLSRKKNYKINLKRVTGSTSFMAYPYEFNLGSSLKSEYSIESELSEVKIEPVSIKVKVVCPKSEVYPTLHGYARTVWDDEWKDLDLKNGILNGNYEINADYQIGLILDGKMETVTSKLDKNVLDFEFKLEDEECSKMGW